jgi:hypothetical protein
MSDGAAFCTVGSRGNLPGGVYELQKDEEELSATWVLLPGTSEDSDDGRGDRPYGLLFGDDGDSLVLAAASGLVWVKPRIRQQ